MTLQILSWRNAKRQIQEYGLYFVTLSCAVSFMYAFNGLVFSSHVKALSELEILPYMVIATSVLIIFVLGWIVSYMTSYMLKRRSKELALYMISGLSNKIISKLVYRENLIIGAAAFLLGLPIGVLFSQLLEASILSIFRMEYSLDFSFSLSTAVLTVVYFSAMFLYAMHKCGKRIRKEKLYGLLYYDRSNEKVPVSGRSSSVAVFFASIVFCGAGIFLLNVQPVGNGYDILMGLVLLVLFLFCFLLSIPSFLMKRLEKWNVWKYNKANLLIFRGFTSKIHSMSLSLSILSVLFMLAITFLGVGIGASRIADRSMEMEPFDVIILHMGDKKDLSDYDNVISGFVPVKKSYTYNIYTGTQREFFDLRDDVLETMDRSISHSYAEFQNDTYMKQSDYRYLREMLGYENLEMDDNSCYVHCIPPLEKEFSKYFEQKGVFEFQGQQLNAGSVLSEPFSQYDTYGNGFHYLVIIPDHLADEMKVLYRMHSVITQSPLTSSMIHDITETSNGLVTLNRNVVMSSGDGLMTSLGDMGVDYLCGKWAKKESFYQIYALLICLFYMALILEIAGAAILATQVLSDREKKKRQDTILRQLGMKQRQIARLNNKQLSLIFLLPVIPSLIISISLVYWGCLKMQISDYNVPVFSDNLWVAQSLGGALLFFAVLYGIYYWAARISSGR